MRRPLLIDAWPSLLLTLGAVVLLLGSALGAPTERAIGSQFSEAPAHLWSTWAWLEGLSTHGPLVVAADGDFPVGIVQPSTNPSNLVVALPLWLLGGGGRAGAVLAWNGLHLFGLLAGGLGMFALARRVVPREQGGAPWVWALAVGALLCSAYLVGQPFRGRSEYFMALLWPGHLALLLGFLEGGRWWWGVGSAVLLALLVLGGPYLGPFVLVLELPLGVALWWGRPTIPRLMRLLGVGGLALALVAPVVWGIFQTPFPDIDALGASSGWAMRAGGLEQLGWMVRWTGPEGLQAAMGPGQDLLVGPDRSVPGLAYPGLVALVLGLLGLARGRSLGWLMLGLWACLLSLGPMLRAPSDALFSLPVAWLVPLIEPLGLVRNWNRIGCLLGVPMGLAAALGVAQVRARWPWMGRWVPGLALVALLADQLSYPMPWSSARPTVDPAAPAALVAGIRSLPPGAVLSLPVSDVVVPDAPHFPRLHLLWQLQHGRPVSEAVGDHADSTLAWGGLARTEVWSRSRGPKAEQLRSRLARLDSQDLGCARAGVQQLLAHGFVGLYLADPGGPHPVFRQWLLAAMGAPLVEAEGTLLWDLQQVPETAGEGCRQPPMPPGLDAHPGAPGPGQGGGR